MLQCDDTVIALIAGGVALRSTIAGYKAIQLPGYPGGKPDRGLVVEPSARKSRAGGAERADKIRPAVPIRPTSHPTSPPPEYPAMLEAKLDHIEALLKGILGRLGEVPGTLDLGH